MKINANFFFFLLLTVKGILCNIWDNIYSNVNSPQYEIPEEFKMTLINDLTQETISELFVSSSLNKVKLTLIMQKQANEMNRFINFVVDMSNGTMTVDSEDKCLYRNISGLNKFTVKFFLNSYDLFSYFKENETFYDYVITNPLSYNDSLKEIIKTVYDQPYYVNLRVNKEKLSLEKVVVNYENVQAITMTPKMEYRNMTEEDFKLMNSVCIYAKEENEIKQFVNKQSFRFLS